jgi:hypothetical protein
MDRRLPIRLLTRAAPFAVASVWRNISLGKNFAVPGFFHSLKPRAQPGMNG